SFYVALVAPPSSGKSQAMKMAVDPLKKIEKEQGDHYAAAKERYKRDKAAFEEEKRARARRSVSSPPKPRPGAVVPVKGLDADGPEPPTPVQTPAPPPRPIRRRVMLDKVTGAEKLIRLLSENPRGLLQCKDELTALIGGMNQYRGGRGDDRQTYLSLWSGAD